MMHSNSSVVDAYSNTLVRQTGVSSLTTVAFALAATTVGNYALFGGGENISSTTYKMVDVALAKGAITKEDQLMIINATIEK